VKGSLETEANGKKLIKHQFKKEKDKKTYPPSR